MKKAAKAFALGDIVSLAEVTALMVKTNGTSSLTELSELSS